MIIYLFMMLYSSLETAHNSLNRRPSADNLRPWLTSQLLNPYEEGCLFRKEELFTNQ